MPGGPSGPPSTVGAVNDHHTFVQAEVPPLDEDGVTAAKVGTILFAVAGLVCWWQLPRLEAAGDAWWLWVCVAGVVLGALGWAWNARRRRRRSAQRNSESSTVMVSQTGIGSSESRSSATTDEWAPQPWSTETTRPSEAE